MDFPSARLLVFARPPVAGRSKTRLIPALGAAGAAALHERLVHHTLASAVGARLCPVELWCADAPDHPFFNVCRTRFGVTLKQQTGADLGERMAHALGATLAEADYAVLIGSDCPSLTASDLRAALAALATGADCVLKPAEDGGYVLIGSSRPAPELFDDMPWGSARVMQRTETRLTALGWRWQALAPGWDVDRPEDLERVKKRFPALCGYK